MEYSTPDNVLGFSSQGRILGKYSAGLSSLFSMPNLFLPCCLALRGLHNAPYADVLFGRYLHIFHQCKHTSVPVLVALAGDFYHQFACQIPVANERRMLLLSCLLVDFSFSFSSKFSFDWSTFPACYFSFVFHPSP